MAIAYKVLGQVLPAATTLTTLYTVPASTSAVCSTLVICNQGLGTAYRVAVRPGGATLNSKHYIIYDAEAENSESQFLTLGVTLAASDVISVYAGTANVAFHLYGSEVT